MSDQTDKALLHYLNKKGYRRAEEYIREEFSSKTAPVEQLAFDIYTEQDVQLNNYLITPGSIHDSISSLAFSNNPESYNSQFQILKKWTKNSLDIYKAELLHLLYPIYVHCYLEMILKGFTKEGHEFLNQHKEEFSETHLDEINHLSTIYDVVHLKENASALAFRNNKYNLKLSLYSFELVITFINENRLTILRKIVNQYLNLIVFDGLTTKDAMEEGLDLTLESKRGSQTQQPRVYWGTLLPNLKYEEELWKQFKASLMGSVKPDQLTNIVAQMKKLVGEPSRESPGKDRIPLPESDFSVELNNLKELSKRVSISTSAHCIFSSFSLNTLTFSPDFHYVAGGFNDSYIEIWSLKREKIKSLKKSTDIILLDMDSVNDLNSIKEETFEVNKRLLGHSGPVYSCSFTKDQRFLFSASQDSTVRLWSLDTFSNVVCYRSHEGPVWDVAPGPQGLYFATASSDRTARLWSTEYITPLRLFVGHLSDVECVRFHPNSNYVVTGSADKSVRVWDIQQGNCVRLFNGHKSPVMSVAVSNDGKHIASGDTKGNVILWDIGSGKTMTTYHGKHQQMITSLDFNMDSNILVAGSADGVVTVCDVKDEKGTNKSSSKKVDANEANYDPYISIFRTKQTPIYTTYFTLRNLLLVAGPFVPN